MAGIHAVGATGVVHYLREHLSEVYQQVRQQRFSVIRCTFDPITRQIASAHPVTHFYTAP
ncbi:hypothetical protein J5X84_41215 [Streptosporangiaceae bacterium NEAU-GS5]|nr:hypothetical protein [Streptosporangiaceae bacterium NEAU-GS5]